MKKQPLCPPPPSLSGVAELFRRRTSTFARCASWAYYASFWSLSAAGPFVELQGPLRRCSICKVAGSASSTVAPAATCSRRRERGWRTF
eukprot:scaffold69_cov248-Pinguiococcus_pyrenoidosus.AAC.25